MGCNCKKNYDALEPFSDEHIEGQGEKKESILRKIVMFTLEKKEKLNERQQDLQD